MKKDLYLMRHGQTLFNKLHKIQGASDSPLTNKGILDAQKVGQYFQKQHLTFDHAYSSTQERASDTLELVTKQSYERVKGLKEWNFGVFEGESESLNPPHAAGQISYGDFFLDFDGESATQVQQRMVRTLQQIMQVDNTQQVLAVSHGGACFMFLLNWLDYAQVKQYLPLPNCCVLHFTFENNKFTFLEMLNVAH
ncbi:histidine phosphatase family protein [Bombilactobacillus thymidiniphilus]|uniref:Histidine phosphatase family protein n=1 Tax=Bombilactobacillus thymidiniphilus TaxID=2923363 RepID=A0ABY4PF58_9LACO|nr:histidine phosphatase family protein [Bombilactobacillus thymidiniphilus]UQS84210.1 histidine phosphatase family protein [Bombilactobacillus thymidiniphilus]